MQVPEFWRGPDNRLYRIRRERRALEDQRGLCYTVRAEPLGARGDQPTEASVALRESDLLEMVRLNQQIPTPEQLYGEAFQAVMAQISRN